MTMRQAIAAAQAALDDSRPDEENLIVARAALEAALDLLDGSQREVGAFHDAEPFRLVLDPLPYAPPLASMQPTA